MRIELAVIAEYAILDVQGKMSMLGIFDVIGATQFPLVYPRLFVCLRIATQSIEIGSKHRVSLQLHTEDGQPLGPRLQNEITVNAGPVPGMVSYTQAVLGFDGLMFPRDGMYSFDVAIDDNHQRSIPLCVTTVPARPS